MTRREELLTLLAAAYQGYVANSNAISFDIAGAIWDAQKILQKIDEVEPVDEPLDKPETDDNIIDDSLSEVRNYDRF
jgi:hypothetical protein